MDDTVGSDKSIFTQILREFNEEAKRNGTADMSLKEINEEIDAVRREAEEQKRRGDSSISEILKRANEEAERNGTADMTLDEINAEIDAARRERE